MQINPAIPGKLTRVATGNVGTPRLSADGSTIVYTKWVNNQWDVMRYRDGKTIAVSDDPHNDVGPSVSGDGDTVVFSRYSKLDGTDTSGNFDVYEWHNGVTKPLADTPADEMQPSISTDGKTVAWTYDDPSKTIGYDIQENHDGKTSNVTTGWPVDTHPLVNQDGSRIFFRRKIAYDDGDLWMRDEHGQLKQLTHTPYKEFNPAIDAPGKTLAWSEDNGGPDQQMVVLDVDHGTRTVTSETGVDETDPSLSADGKTVAYTRQVHHEPAQVMLEENGKTVPLTLDGWNGWPKVSADGRVITWLNVEPGQNGASLYRFERP